MPAVGPGHAESMALGFGGEIAELYHRYRRGYPTEVIDRIIDALSLTADDLVIDVGCGTGQLTTSVAPHVRAAIGVDPEADMLAVARAAAQRDGVADVAWLLGTDSDLPLLASVLGPTRVGAVTVGQALHWMDHGALFAAAGELVRPGSRVAVVTNGTPLWLQDSPWSRALADWLAGLLGTRPVNSCGTDAATQARYRESLADHDFAVRELIIEYSEELDLDRLAGGVFSAFPVDRLPPADQRVRLADELAEVLDPHRPFIEHVPVRVIIGIKPGRTRRDPPAAEEPGRP